MSEIPSKCPWCGCAISHEIETDYTAECTTIPGRIVFDCGYTLQFTELNWPRRNESALYAAIDSCRNLPDELARLRELLERMDELCVVHYDFLLLECPVCFNNLAADGGHTEKCELGLIIADIRAALAEGGGE